MAADVENVENDLFEKALSDSLRDFVHITQLKVEQKHCLRSLVEKKDVFGILPTGFGKSIIFQILPRVMKVLWNLDDSSSRHTENARNTSFTRQNGSQKQTKSFCSFL